MVTLPNLQYDYILGADGPLAELHTRSAYPDLPVMISPPIGWVPLVQQLDRDIRDVLPHYTIAQVKEKYGELRFYIEHYGVPREDPRVLLARGMIAEAENASKRICQVCGRPATYRSDFGLHGTLCDEHALAYGHKIDA